MPTPPLRVQPSRAQLFVHKAQEIEGAHKDVYVAIRDGFAALRRQLQDYVHCLRNEVKTHLTA